MTAGEVIVDRALTGVVAAERVHELRERIPSELLERLRAVRDLSATVSDVLDLLGIEEAVGASELRPTIAEARVVGTAVTVRKVPQRRAPDATAGAGESDMGEIEGANQAEPGDVLVIEGLAGVSAMGGLMSMMAKREGAAGAVIDGGFRDVSQAREIGFPVWSADVTPVTGKWRSVVAEVNGPVTIRGCVVDAGDLVVADETGVCFVPATHAAAVADRAVEVAAAEDLYRAALAGGQPLHELIRSHRGDGAAE